MLRRVQHGTTDAPASLSPSTQTLANGMECRDQVEPVAKPLFALAGEPFDLEYTRIEERVSE